MNTAQCNNARVKRAGIEFFTRAAIHTRTMEPGTLDVIILHQDGSPHGQSTTKQMICSMFFYFLLLPLKPGPRFLFQGSGNKAS